VRKGNTRRFQKFLVPSLYGQNCAAQSIEPREVEGMIWFTGDEHYGHKNIIEYAKRPFSSIEEMNSILIDRHNEVVARGDIVYHLGDFTFIGDPSKYLDSLNGQHFLIKGNHDHRRLRKDPAPFGWVKDVHMAKLHEHRFFLSHYSHRVWPRSHYGVYHLYGHSHSTLPDLNRSTDAGVDAHRFYPISAEQVVEKLKSIVPRQVDHHAIAFKEVL